jgi:putative ABC transport system ATP-binding protein
MRETTRVGAGIALRLEGVRKEYPIGRNTIRAVDGIDLAVEAGSRVAIIGPSGCGKSTLLGLIGGLEPPTAGRIWLGESEVSALSDAKRAELRRRSIGFVFQSYDLLPFLTATENIEFQLALTGNGGSDGSARARELVERLGLVDHAAKLPDQLSGGQRQRVGIARALAHQPGLILGDEPTGELDSESSAAAMDLLLEAQSTIGATLVVVTHDPDVAARLDRVLTLRDGILVSDRRNHQGPGAGA